MTLWLQEHIFSQINEKDGFDGTLYHLFTGISKSVIVVNDAKHTIKYSVKVHDPDQLLSKSVQFVNVTEAQNGKTLVRCQSGVCRSKCATKKRNFQSLHDSDTRKCAHINVLLEYLVSMNGKLFYLSFLAFKYLKFICYDQQSLYC